MKKILLALVALVATTASLNAQKKVITETAVSSADASVVITHRFYNEQGNVIYKLIEGVSESTYSYNDLNQLTTEEYNVFNNYNAGRTYVYNYTEGQLVSREEKAGERVLSTVKYDEYGNPSGTLSANGLEIPQQNTYDDDHNLLKSEIKHPIAGIVMSTTAYTYSDGVLVKKETSNSAGVVTETVTYTYENGQLAKTTASAGDDGTVETVFNYGDIDAYYAPQNVQAVANQGNTVTLSWSGSADAVVFNGQYIEVKGTSYTTDVLQDGTYTFYVSNQGNAVVVPEVTVFDNSKVGVFDVVQNGDVKVQTVVSVDDQEQEKRTTTYYIPVKWSIDEEAKPIGYRIYYNDNYYVDVEDGTITEYIIPATNVTIWNGAVVTLPFKVTVQAVYATGVADPDNVLELDTDAILAIEPEVVNGISSVSASQFKASGVYNLNGVRVANSVNGLTRGLYIVRQGNMSTKVIVR